MKKVNRLKTLLASTMLLSFTSHAADFKLLSPPSLNAQSNEATRFLNEQRQSARISDISFVTINANFLGKAVNGNTVSLDIGGKSIELTVKEISRSGVNKSRVTAVNKNRNAQLQLVKVGANYAGSILLGKDRFRIKHYKGDLYTLIKVNNHEYQDHPADYSEKHALKDLDASLISKAQVQDTGDEYTVIVAYTPQFASVAGNIPAYMDLLELETNTAYSNSLVNTTMKIVHYYPTGHNDTGNMNTDINILLDTSNPHGAELANLRDQYGADLMIFLTGNSYGYCGLANAIGATASNAIAGATEDCATGYYSFGHEIGHLFGARHIIQNDPNTSPFAYGHGYCNVTPNTWRTTMAYGCPSGTGGPRIQQWSSPLVFVGGEVTGSASVEDNARVHNVRAETVANFRQTPGNQAPVAQFSTSSNDLTVTFTNTSSDDVSIASYDWDFGDGSSSSSENPQHTYASAGTYTVTLTVTDGEGLTDDASQSVTVPFVQLETVGNTAIFGSSTTTANRRAMPYTMPEDGIIKSITMYHQGGSGDMLLGVYNDNGSGAPQLLLGSTVSTAVSGTTGWQTIQLTNDVTVASGDTIWLAWVYESNPGIFYESGTVGRYDAGVGWAGGMPANYGSGTQANFIYSIYANYEPTVVVPPACDVDEGFESGAGGWTNDSASSCSTGSFVVGSPTEVVNGGVTTQLAGAKSGNNAYFSAVNTSAGSNDVDGGECIVNSPVYSVTQASDVSVSYFHGQRDAGDDANDYFDLEISVNGGAYSSMASFGDVTNNAVWSEANTTVSAGDQVQFRVRVSDGSGPGDLIEAGIDDVKICAQ